MTVPNLLQISKSKLNKDKNFSTIIISSCKHSQMCMLYKFRSKASEGFRFKIPNVTHSYFVSISFRILVVVWVVSI